MSVGIPPPGGGVNQPDRQLLRAQRARLAAPMTEVHTYDCSTCVLGGVYVCMYVHECDVPSEAFPHKAPVNSLYTNSCTFNDGVVSE